MGKKGDFTIFAGGGEGGGVKKKKKKRVEGSDGEESAPKQREDGSVHKEA